MVGSAFGGLAAASSVDQIPVRHVRARGVAVSRRGRARPAQTLLGRAERAALCVRCPVRLGTRSNAAVAPFSGLRRHVRRLLVRNGHAHREGVRDQQGCQLIDETIVRDGARHVVVELLMELRRGRPGDPLNWWGLWRIICGCPESGCRALQG
eukprot:4878425-Prymnesium_polylepis.1